jgi:hypothetical protein
MPQAAILLALLAIIIPTTCVSFLLVLFGLRGEAGVVTTVTAS